MADLEELEETCEVMMEENKILIKQIKTLEGNTNHLEENLQDKINKNKSFLSSIRPSPRGERSLGHHFKGLNVQNRNLNSELNSFMAESPRCNTGE